MSVNLPRTGLTPRPNGGRAKQPPTLSCRKNEPASRKTYSARLKKIPRAYLRGEIHEFTGACGGSLKRPAHEQLGQPAIPEIRQRAHAAVDRPGRTRHA